MDEPRASYAITLKLPLYVDARDEDAITLGTLPLPRLPAAAGTVGVGGDASGDEVWRVAMTAVMARPEPARNVDSVWDRRHGYEALSVS